MEEKPFSLLGYIGQLILLLLVMMAIKGSVLGSYRIPSESMVPTLQIGDFIFVWHLSYGFRWPWALKTSYRWSDPSRGDIVVFRRPDDPETPVDESADNIVKRVIAVGGDKIEVNRTQVILNDKLVPKENYAIWSDSGLSVPHFGPVTVPKGHVLVLGDNRDLSQDSRFWSNYFLPLENIKGRALMVYFSIPNLSRIGTILR
jgi:signal peptidase I